MRDTSWSSFRTLTGRCTACSIASVLHRSFDVILDSKVEGLEKPDRRFFDLALSRSESTQATTVHAGDFYNFDVAGARGAGLQAILIDDADLHRAIARASARSPSCHSYFAVIACPWCAAESLFQRFPSPCLWSEQRRARCSRRRAPLP